MDNSENDELWDYYSGLPNPMWYQHIKEIKDADQNISNNKLSKKLTNEKNESDNCTKGTSFSR